MGQNQNQNQNLLNQNFKHFIEMNVNWVAFTRPKNYNEKGFHVMI